MEAIPRSHIIWESRDQLTNYAYIYISPSSPV